MNMAPLEGALDMIREAGIEAIRRKSLGMTGYFMELADKKLAPLGVKIVTPREDERRGGHVTILHTAAQQITEFLDGGSQFTEERKKSVLQKQKEGKQPTLDDQVRIAFSPLFSSFLDVWQTAENLYQLLKEN